MTYQIHLNIWWHFAGEIPWQFSHHLRESVPPSTVLIPKKSSGTSRPELRKDTRLQLETRKTHATRNSFFQNFPKSPSDFYAGGRWPPHESLQFFGAKKRCWDKICMLDLPTPPGMQSWHTRKMYHVIMVVSVTVCIYPGTLSWPVFWLEFRPCLGWSFNDSRSFGL